MSKRISQLVESVARGKVRHDTIDELRARARTRLVGEDALEATQREIISEMADVLGRSHRRVDEAFDKLGELDEAIVRLQRGQADATGRLAELTRAHNAQRSQAQRRLWELFVHREAIGLLRHDRLRQEYRLPPKR